MDFLDSKLAEVCVRKCSEENRISPTAERLFYLFPSKYIHLYFVEGDPNVFVPFGEHIHSIKEGI